MAKKVYSIAREFIRFVIGLVVSFVMIGVGIVGVEKITGFDLTGALETLQTNSTNGPAIGAGIAIAGIAIGVGIIMGKTIAALKE